MKKIFNILLILLVGIILAGCHKEIQDDNVIVVFHSDGGSYVETAIVKPGSTVAKPDDPTKLGGEFVEWVERIYDEKGTSYTERKWRFETDIVKESMTLHAVWTWASYKIIYELDGGYLPAAEDTPGWVYHTEFSVISDTIFLKPPTSQYYPVHPDRGRFRGWWDEPNLTADERRDKPQITMIETGTIGDVTLYAYYR